MASIKYKDPSTNLWEEVGEIIKGKDAAYVGSSAPTDPQYTIWVDTSETGEGLVTSVNGQVGAVTVSVSEIGTIKIYHDVTDLGLTSGSATIADAWSALPLNSMLIADGASFESVQVPTRYGVVKMTKINTSRPDIEFVGKYISGSAKSGIYRKGMSGSEMISDAPWQVISTPWKTSVTLASANWSGNGPYTQSVTISGVLSNSKVDIQPNATAIQQMIDDGCAAIYIENTSGTLTAYAIGSAPTANLTVQVTITEVS